MTDQPNESAPASAARPEELVERLFPAYRRILIMGPPGVGKSTLAGGMAETLLHGGRSCACIGADPGTPSFGVPGAVCLAHRSPGRWRLEALEALCTLDAGRFRLPLTMAVAHLAQRAAADALLLDAPGVVRGVAGTELLGALVAAARIELVLWLSRVGGTPSPAQALEALPVPVRRVQAAPGACRPGSRARARQRTRLWDAYLASGADHSLSREALRVIGTPPPADVPEAWVGRQVAVMDGAQTVTMGEIRAVNAARLELRLGGAGGGGPTLMMRDARRLADGRLGTAERFGADRLEYLPPPDVATRAPLAGAAGPRVCARVGSVDVALPNGVFGDPLLHVRLRHRRRSLIFDLGEGSRLPARLAHQVTDVFISHAHIDHIAGFLWLLRSRIGACPVCRLFGPPGLAANIEGLTRGILWDRAGERGPRFEVGELHGARLRRFDVRAGRPGPEALEERPAPHGVLLAEAEFQVRAVELQHSSPVLAFALEPAPQINVRKDRLAARGLAPGPWLGELKRCLRSGDRDALIDLPGQGVEVARSLASDLVMVAPGKRLVYATDLADSAENRRRLVGLAQGAHTLFCEASFIEADADRAARTAHLTTRACGEIAVDAGVARLVPFHFSRRYEDDPQAVYREIAEVCPAAVTPKTPVA